MVQFGIYNHNYMAVVVYFKTEKDEVDSKLYTNGWLWFETSINNTPARETIRSASGQSKHRSLAAVDENIYCHIEAPTEPVGDGSIKTTDFVTTGTETDTEYSGNGIIKSFTSETGFFSAVQNWDTHENLWIAHWTGRYANKTSGYSPYIQFRFYKRDASNNDTLLFTIEPSSLSTFALANGYSTSFSPAGTVATTDRLRIEVYGNERIGT